MAPHPARTSPRGSARTRTTAVAGAALATALVLALGACGSSGSSSAEPGPSPSTPTSAGPAAAPSATPPTEPTEPAEPAGPATPATTPLALFLGDSYVVDGAYTSTAQNMAALAADQLGWRSVIRGGGGTGFVAANPEYDLPDYLGQIDDGALDVGDRTVDWLVVEGGGNDRTEDPALVEQRAVEVLARAAALHPGARVVLVGAMDPTVDDFSDYDPVNGALRSAAATAGVPFVDPQRWLAGRPDLVGPDFDHPLPEGAQLMGRNLAEALAALTP